LITEDERESLSDIHSLQRLAQSPRAGIDYEVGHRGAENRADNEVDNPH
jgi:hypothetical protein